MRRSVTKVRVGLAAATSVAVLGGAAIAVSGTAGGSTATQATGIHKIQHVVVIMQENRSFDTYFGAYPGADGMKVSSARGEFIAKAMVTRRIKPMMIDGKKTYQIGIPIHWGFRGIAEDAGRTAHTPTNLLSPTVIDPNAFTPEFKGFLVKVERA